MSITDIALAITMICFFVTVICVMSVQRRHDARIWVLEQQMVNVFSVANRTKERVDFLCERYQESQDAENDHLEDKNDDIDNRLP